MAAVTEEHERVVEDVPDIVDADQDEDDNEENDQTAMDGDDDDMIIPGRGKLNRMEKKSRKAMQKLGMKPVPGIRRVTIKKSKNILFVIGQPDVFKSPVSDAYVVFGEANIEDLNAQAQAQAAQQFDTAEQATESKEDFTQAAAGSDEPDEEVDESGLDASDISMVVDQTKVKRSVAVKALRDNDGDIVNAIMDLTAA